MPQQKISKTDEAFTLPEGWLLLAVPNGKPYIPGASHLDERAFDTRKFNVAEFNQSGVRGPQGPPGATGTDGPTGARGETGDTGAKGAAGAAGGQGPDGSSPVEVSYADSIAKDYFGGESLGPIAALSGGTGWDGIGFAEGATVVSRPRIGQSTENRIELINGQIGRKFAWGSDWNRLIISIALRINAVANFTGNYHFGVCSGVDNMPGDATTDNFVGLAGATSGTVNWTRTLGTKFNHYVNAAGIMATRRGTTTTARDTTGNGLRICEDERNTLIIQTILSRNNKGAGYIIADAKCDATTAGYHSAKQSVQFTSLRSDPPPTNLLALTDTCPTFNFDESTGALDTLHFSWQSATPVEIAAVCAVRHY